MKFGIAALVLFIVGCFREPGMSDYKSSKYDFCEAFVSYAKYRFQENEEKRFKGEEIRFKECSRVTATLTKEQKKYAHTCTEPFQIKWQDYMDTEFLHRCLNTQGMGY